MVAIVTPLVQAPALAAVQFSGDRNAVSIQARKTSIEQILKLLGREFDLQYTSSISLDREISGIFKGTLTQVVERILDGFNFVVKTDGRRIDIAVLGIGTNISSAGAAATHLQAPKGVTVLSAPGISASPLITSPELRSATPLSAATETSGSANLNPGPVALPTSEGGPVPVGPGRIPELTVSEVLPPQPLPTSSPLDAPWPEQNPLSSRVPQPWTKPNTTLQ